MTTSMLVVIGLVFVAIVLFFWEPLRLDLLALIIPISLVFLEPWTMVSTEEALSGFANKATITVMAMFVLSHGIRKSGLVQILGEKISNITGNSEIKQLTAITTLAGFISGIINNTPVVAIFIPMVTNMAEKIKISPSKYLIPLSYASMMGGVMTLIGTSTNILASDISERLINHPFNMFEFTKMGLILFLIGLIYLITISRYIIPERIEAGEDLIEEYEVKDYLSEVVIGKGSSLIGKTVGHNWDDIDLDIDLVEIIRSGKQYIEPLFSKTFQEGDHLIIKADKSNLLKLLSREEFHLSSQKNLTTKELEEPKKGYKVVEAVIPHSSFLKGQTLYEANFSERYDASVLAIRRGNKFKHKEMKDIIINPGDVILLLAGETSLQRLRQNNNFIITREIEKNDYRSSKIGIVVSIVAAVVALAAFKIVPIAISALAGIITMVMTGCLKPSELYEAINWEVIFLLAGLIPLGIALEKTGTASFIASKLMFFADFLSPILMLTLFYIFTAVLTNIISNNASVVLMIPIAIEAADKIGANPFAFVLAVTFAASTAFLTSVGYQTNLMVYGPGGYKFRDFFLVGAPLQLIYAVITPLLISFFWGL